MITFIKDLLIQFLKVSATIVAVLVIIRVLFRSIFKAIFKEKWNNITETYGYFKPLIILFFIILAISFLLADKGKGKSNSNGSNQPEKGVQSDKQNGSSIDGNADGSGEKIEANISLNGYSPETYNIVLKINNDEHIFYTENKDYLIQLEQKLKLLGIKRGEVSAINMQSGRSIPSTARLQIIQNIEWFTRLTVKETKEFTNAK